VPEKDSKAPGLIFHIAKSSLGESLKHNPKARIAAIAVLSAALMGRNAVALC
jgi:hypothetical protein